MIKAIRHTLEIGFGKTLYFEKTVYLYHVLLPNCNVLQFLSAKKGEKYLI